MVILFCLVLELLLDLEYLPRTPPAAGVTLQQLVAELAQAIIGPCPVRDFFWVARKLAPN